MYLSRTTFQSINSFKIRGATNAVMLAPDDQGSSGARTVDLGAADWNRT
jgi:threonine dehydratase